MVGDPPHGEVEYEGESSERATNNGIEPAVHNTLESKKNYLVFVVINHDAFALIRN